MHAVWLTCYIHKTSKQYLGMSRRSSIAINRGGVENTRLEAKDTKKFRRQEQTLSRPRTTNTDASVPKKSSKIFLGRKRSLKFFFQAISTGGNQKKGICRFSARFLAFFNEISTVQKRQASIFEHRVQKFSRTRNFKARTSKYVLQAKDVLEDSTTGN